MAGSDLLPVPSFVLSSFFRDAISFFNSVFSLLKRILAVKNGPLSGP